MDPVNILKSDGWCLSDEGWMKITDNGNLKNKMLIEKKALDIDLRELGGHSFPIDASRGKIDKLSGVFICQVQKIRNVSAPKANEESKNSPRLLKITLTDGTQVCQAIENTKLNAINLNTPPGTKLKIKGEIDVVSSYLLLDDCNVENLGGNVTHLVEKWQLNRSLAKHTRGRYGVEGGPPPWIPFGQKITGLNISEKDFKSLGDNEKESKENDEFELSRRDAIAEAAAGKSFAKKIFGGGTKPLLDKNVQIIIEEGFTLQQAEGALKQSRNDVKKALRSLQKKTGKTDDKGGNRQDKEGTGGGVGGERPTGGGGGRRGKNKNEDDIPHKPSGPVSLFDYLENKLPPQPVVEKEKEEFNTRNHHRGDNQRGGRGGYTNRNIHNNRNNSYSNSQPSAVGSGVPSNSNNTNNNNINKRYQNKAPRFQQQQSNKMSNTTVVFNNSLPSAYKPGQSGSSRHENKHGSNHEGNRNTFYEQPLHKNDLYNHRNNFGEFRSQSNHYKPSGMPDIPEFPFKDSSFIPPLMSANTLGLFQDYNEYPRSEKWRWKIGDMCMAKYWEDNRYYNAQVTGLSDTTCVVRFMEYGNYEEVLHDDCLPITEESNSNHLPNSRDNHVNDENSYPSGGDRGPPRRDNRRGGNSRYQAMYVPPPGRSRK